MDKEERGMLWISVAVVLLAIILLGVLFGHKPQEFGLRVDTAYIKAVGEREISVNDVYVSTMVNFATKCENNTLFRTLDIYDRLSGVTLFCPQNNSTFTFWYSDKWRQDMYGTK